jgi:hypothetical protein
MVMQEQTVHTGSAGAHTKMPAVLLMLDVAFSTGQTTLSSLEVLMPETSLWRCDFGDGLSSTS